MILFLDIDGVLHPFFPRADLPDEENQHFSYLPRLESVIRGFPELSYTSTTKAGSKPATRSFPI